MKKSIPITQPESQLTSVDEKMLTAIVEISDYRESVNTFHSAWRSMLDGQKSPTSDQYRDANAPLAGRRIRCSIDAAKTGVAGGTLTDFVTVSEHLPQSNTFHNHVNAILYADKLLGVDADKLPAVDELPGLRDRVDSIAGALFYTYVWGWYTGFIEMPYYSIQGLLSNPTVSLTGEAAEVIQGAQETQDMLRQYRLLSSLFADESDLRFDTKNFGFMTPQEAFDEYKHSFDGRFDGYFGRALGEFLESVPSRYQ